MPGAILLTINEVICCIIWFGREKHKASHISRNCNDDNTVSRRTLQSDIYKISIGDEHRAQVNTCWLREGIPNQPWNRSYDEVAQNSRAGKFRSATFPQEIWWSLSEYKDMLYVLDRVRLFLSITLSSISFVLTTLNYIRFQVVSTIAL